MQFLNSGTNRGIKNSSSEITSFSVVPFHLVAPLLKLYGEREVHLSVVRLLSSIVAVAPPRAVHFSSYKTKYLIGTLTPWQTHLPVLLLSHSELQPRLLLQCLTLSAPPLASPKLPMQSSTCST